MRKISQYSSSILIILQNVLLLILSLFFFFFNFKMKSQDFLNLEISEYHQLLSTELTLLSCVYNNDDDTVEL